MSGNEILRGMAAARAMTKAEADAAHERDRAVADAVASTYLYGGAVIGTLQWARHLQSRLAEDGWKVVKA